MGTNGNGLDVNVGKYGVHVGGLNTLIIVVLALALGALVYLDYIASQVMKHDIEALYDEMRLQSWLMTLPLEDRPRIMPPSTAMNRVLEETRKGERGRAKYNNFGGRD